MDEFATIAGLVAIASHLTSLTKYLSAGQVREFLTGLVPIAVLFAVLLLGAVADATSALSIPGVEGTLGKLDVASLALVALAGGSGAAQLFNYRMAVDSSTSSAEPPLGGGPTGGGVT
jgi:hypothetical protein